MRKGQSESKINKKSLRARTSEEKVIWTFRAREKKRNLNSGACARCLGFRRVGAYNITQTRGSHLYYSCRMNQDSSAAKEMAHFASFQLAQTKTTPTPHTPPPPPQPNPPNPPTPPPTHRKQPTQSTPQLQHRKCAAKRSPHKKTLRAGTKSIRGLGAYACVTSPEEQQ